MSVLKTVQQVCKETGLNRKLLHDYDREGIVKPTEYKNRGYTNKRNGIDYDCDGYKLYDDDALMKFHQVAIFKELGMERKEIKKRITALDYDCNQVLDEQLELLRRKKEEIDKLICVAEQLKVIGMKNEVLQFFQGNSLQDFVRMAEKWQNSAYYKDASLMLEEELDDQLGKELDQALDSFFSLSPEFLKSQTASEFIRKLKNALVKCYGLLGYLLMFVLAISVLGEGELALELSQDYGKRISADQARAILKYLEQDISTFLDEAVDVIIETRDAEGKDFNSPQVTQMIERLQRTCYKYFGMTKQAEFGLLFEYVEVEPYEKGDTYIKFVLNALQYHWKTVSNHIQIKEDSHE